MIESVSGSITRNIASLRSGDSEAASALWEKCFPKVVALAKQQFSLLRPRTADEEDIALSVFDTLFRGVSEGRFSSLVNRNDLWCLLIAIVKQKAVSLKRRETRKKRGGGAVVHETDLVSGDSYDQSMFLDETSSLDPTPEFLVALAEQHRVLMDSLRDAHLQRIAALLLEGYSTEQVAVELAVSVRTIQRKLLVIRKCWKDSALKD